MLLELATSSSLALFFAGSPAATSAQHSASTFHLSSAIKCAFSSSIHLKLREVFAGLLLCLLLGLLLCLRPRSPRYFFTLLACSLLHLHLRLLAPSLLHPLCICHVVLIVGQSLELLQLHSCPVRGRGHTGSGGSSLHGCRHGNKRVRKLGIETKTPVCSYRSLFRTQNGLWTPHCPKRPHGSLMAGLMGSAPKRGILSRPCPTLDNDPVTPVASQHYSSTPDLYASLQSQTRTYPSTKCDPLH